MGCGASSTNSKAKEEAHSATQQSVLRQLQGGEMDTHKTVRSSPAPTSEVPAPPAEAQANSATQRSASIELDTLKTVRSSTPSTAEVSAAPAEAQANSATQRSASIEMDTHNAVRSSPASTADVSAPPAGAPLSPRTAPQSPRPAHPPKESCDPPAASSRDVLSRAIAAMRPLPTEQPKTQEEKERLGAIVQSVCEHFYQVIRTKMQPAYLAEHPPDLELSGSFGCPFADAHEVMLFARFVVEGFLMNDRWPQLGFDFGEREELLGQDSGPGASYAQCAQQVHAVCEILSYLQLDLRERPRWEPALPGQPPEARAPVMEAVEGLLMDEDDPEFNKDGRRLQGLELKTVLSMIPAAVFPLWITARRWKGAAEAKIALSTGRKWNLTRNQDYENALSSVIHEMVSMPTSSYKPGLRCVITSVVPTFPGSGAETGYPALALQLGFEASDPNSVPEDSVLYVITEEGHEQAIPVAQGAIQIEAKGEEDDDKEEDDDDDYDEEEEEEPSRSRPRIKGTFLFAVPMDRYRGDDAVENPETGERDVPPTLREALGCVPQAIQFRYGGQKYSRCRIHFAPEGSLSLPPSCDANNMEPMLVNLGDGISLNQFDSVGYTLLSEEEKRQVRQRSPQAVLPSDLAEQLLQKAEAPLQAHNLFHAERVEGEEEARNPLTNTTPLDDLQLLFDKTFIKKYTRDRRGGVVPDRLVITRAQHIDNLGNWIAYAARRHQITGERRALLDSDDISEERKREIREGPFRLRGKKTDDGTGPELRTKDAIDKAFPRIPFVNIQGHPMPSEIRGTKWAGEVLPEWRLDADSNEQYLFHGTNDVAAKCITQGDFRVNLAGSSVGTLYGRGVYLAESVSKSDEYTEENEEGERCLLVCRVALGLINYCDEPFPDVDKLEASCPPGNNRSGFDPRLSLGAAEVNPERYHSVCGDREKCRGTFREIMVYDSAQVYPEYVVWYKREYTGQAGEMEFEDDPDREGAEAER